MIVGNVAGDGGPVAGKPYFTIVAECEKDLARHGDNYLGVGWRKSQGHADLRYRVMLDVVRAGQGPVDLLDLGCGASHLYEFMQAHGVHDIRYSGADLSEKYLAVAASKFPAVTYYQVDVLDGDAKLPSFDYVVMNGLFNYKGDAPYVEMVEYVQAMLTRVAAIARVGFAFNVMSKHVDWERPDLFHWPIEDATAFIAGHVSRSFVVRHDYGLYEYTVYAYKASLGAPAGIL